MLLLINLLIFFIHFRLLTGHRSCLLDVPPVTVVAPHKVRTTWASASSEGTALAQGLRCAATLGAALDPLPIIGTIASSHRTTRGTAVSGIGADACGQTRQPSSGCLHTSSSSLKIPAAVAPCCKCWGAA